jgi:hypothetical protein
MMRRFALAVAAVSLLAAANATAGSMFDPQAAGFRPRVPVSSLGSLGSWFDRSRLHMSSTTTFGTGWGGNQASGLQVTSFAYDFKAPLSMNVSVGNAFGAGSASGSSMFLEGLNLTYRPNNRSVFMVQFRDIRSPLQYGYGNPYDLRGPGAGGWIR